MVVERLNTQELFSSLDKVWLDFFNQADVVDGKKFNIVPFKDSWTIGQLTAHVKKSNKAIVQALQMNGMPCERNADERVSELKNTFLNFAIKFQSPDFIVPENIDYKKEEILNQYKNSFEQLKQLRSTVNLFEKIYLPAFGEVTKLEILYFVLYHTQRHLRQLRNIVSVLSS